jgi:hypothetical protein
MPSFSTAHEQLALSTSIYMIARFVVVVKQTSGSLLTLLRCAFLILLLSDNNSMVLNGYDMDFEPLVQKLFTVFDTADAVVAEVAKLVRQYLTVEQLFAGQPSRDEVITNLIKNNKESLHIVST